MHSSTLPPGLKIGHPEFVAVSRETINLKVFVSTPRNRLSGASPEPDHPDRGLTLLGEFTLPRGGVGVEERLHGQKGVS